MKKVVLLLAVVVMASCGHDHSKDAVVGNVHTLYTKENKDLANKMQADMLLMRKKLIDSMIIASKKSVPVAVGFYASSEMKLPTGTIIDFHPLELKYTGPGPYIVVIKGFDGKQSINKIDREKWLMFHRGDVIK